MRLVVALTFLFMALSVKAETVTIHSTNSSFIKLMDGRVYFWNENTLRDFSETILFQGQSARIKLNSKNEILSLRPIHVFKQFRSLRENQNVDLEKPTLFLFSKNITKLMDSFRTNDTEDSQCYDRGHVWAYESYEKSGIKLQKAWIFFADHYIEKYRFKWWFHIAPLAQLKTVRETQSKVLDKKFSPKPQSPREWSDLFMENKAACKEIELYTDYSLHAGEDDCYYMTSSRFMWQPRDLEDLALNGNLKNAYVEWELRHAFKFAFGVENF